jgi:uncharacterized protein
VPGERGFPWRESCSVPVSSIPRDGRETEERFELPVPGIIEYWGQEFRAPRPVRVRATLRRFDRRILTELLVEADLEVPCARCLVPTNLSIRQGLEGVFLLGPEEKRGKDRDEEESDEEDRDESTVLDALAEEIPLDSQIWEALVLALPSAALCRVDCKGICPVCGSDRNRFECSCSPDGVDPRLEELRTLFGAPEGTPTKGGK